jgi:hypothetical protein
LAGVSIYFARHAAFSIFHPLTLYIAFHGLIFVIRPIIGYFVEYRYIYANYGFTPSPEDKLTVIFAANLGFLVFAFFCLRTGSAAMTFKQDGFVVAERQRFKRIFPWVLAVCVPLGLYSLIVDWIFASGAESYIQIYDKVSGVRIKSTGSGYQYEAQLVLASSAAILAWLFRFRLVAWLPLVTFVVARAGTGGRGPFVAGSVAAGLLYLYEKRRKMPGPYVVLGAAVLLAAFSLVGDDRGRSIREFAGTELTTARNYGGPAPNKFMEGMDFGNLEYFEFLVYVIPQRSQTYDYFIDNLQILTEPVPRALWKDKPVGEPFIRVSMFEYGTPYGMTRSLPGEGWYAWGWIGVVLWCGLWGWALGWIYQKFATGPQGTIHTAAYLIFLPSLIVAYRDGTVITILRYNLFYLTPIAVWYCVARLQSVPSAKALRNSALRQWRQKRRNMAAAQADAQSQDGADAAESALPRAERLARKRIRQLAARRQPKLLR